jgi:hypothetical protein
MGSPVDAMETRRVAGKSSRDDYNNSFRICYFLELLKLIKGVPL